MLPNTQNRSCSSVWHRIVQVMLPHEVFGSTCLNRHSGWRKPPGFPVSHPASFVNRRRSQSAPSLGLLGLRTNWQGWGSARPAVAVPKAEELRGQGAIVETLSFQSSSRVSLPEVHHALHERGEADAPDAADDTDLEDGDEEREDEEESEGEEESDEELAGGQVSSRSVWHPPPGAQLVWRQSNGATAQGLGLNSTVPVGIFLPAAGNNSQASRESSGLATGHFSFLSINAFVQRLSNVEIVPNGRDAESCPICLEDHLEGQLVRKLPCSHLLHEKCATLYFESKGARPVCPLCRCNFVAPQTDGR